MIHVELARKTKSSSHWTRLAAAGLLAVAALAGCGGGGGDVTPPPVVSAPTGSVPAPTGTSPVNVASLTAAQFAALTPTVTVGAVTIQSPPVVTFAMSDGPTTNNPIIGFNYTNKPASTNLTSLANMRFSLAKLVPGKDGNVSKWVNYIVTTAPTLNADGSVKVSPVPTTPTTDQHGTLVDNKNGTYTYTFGRDITAIKALVDEAALTAPKVAADLGDLTFEPTLTHRLTIQISGSARGTGTNTADGSSSGVTAVSMANPVNVIYDFIPATGKAVAVSDFQHEIVSKTVCNECHEKLTVHGSRNDTQYCVVCHNDQLKFGKINVASTNGKFPALTEVATKNAVTGITSYKYTTTMSVADGEVLGDFPVMVHKIHSGGDLVKENYNLANVVLDEKGFSILGSGQKMCAKCHDNTKAAQADNWHTKPSQLACGSCHDGINWKTGGGSTLADKAVFAAANKSIFSNVEFERPVLATSGHEPGLVLDNASCSICHTSVSIKVSHQTENITKHNPTVKLGLVTFTYDIKSAEMAAAPSTDVIVKFQINADGTPISSLAPEGFTGSPSFLLAYARTQDGIAPADYNNLGRTLAQPISVRLSTLGNKITGPVNGVFTATLSGTEGTDVFYADATMRAVGLQGYYSQTKAPADGTVGNAIPRHAISVVKEVTGDTVRRKVVDSAKCSNCHEWYEAHGGNRVYEVQVCVMCHTPGMTTSGRGITDKKFKEYIFDASQKKMLKEWGFDPATLLAGTNLALNMPVTTNNFKDMIHGVHAGRESANPFRDARNGSGTSITLLDFKRLDFPGKISNCETCHIAGTYTSVPSGALASTYESIDATYAAALAADPSTATTVMAADSLKTASATDKVTSPYAASCIGCHNSPNALLHLKDFRSVSVQEVRSEFNKKAGTESCGTCHGVGKPNDITVVHK